MEQLKVLDYSDVFIACYFTDSAHCVHSNREHTLMYVDSGELEIDDAGRRTVIRAGECAFMRRDHRMILHKHASPEAPYRSFVLKFSRSFLRDMFRQIPARELPADARRTQESLVRLPQQRPDVVSLFQSIKPFLESEMRPSEEWLRLKLTEGAYVILNTDRNLYASMFDFADMWKIDILEYLNANYMYDLSLEEIATYTGRSLATFKRDFAKISSLTPQKWIIRRRLEAARELIMLGGRKVTEICHDVGFKNLSHFSRLYKDTYGVTPAAHQT